MWSAGDIRLATIVGLLHSGLILCNVQTSYGTLPLEKFVFHFGQLADSAVITMSIAVVTLHDSVTFHL